MSTPDLDAIQARADKATPGPWEPDTGTRGDCVVWGPNGRFLMNMQSEPHWLEYPGEKRSVSFDVDARDADFIAHARTDVPALLALARSQQAQIERVQAAAEWVRDNHGDYISREIEDRIRAALTATEATP